MADTTRAQNAMPAHESVHDDSVDTPVPFDAPLDLVRLAAEQGVEPITSIDELAGDFWPTDEGPDEFVAALREWRRA